MNLVTFLNGWGASWAGFMTRALVDASVLLAVVVLVWLPLRKRMSAQLAHGLFCLVLLKLIVPAPASWPSWAPTVALQPSRGVTSEEHPLALPTTGDVGTSLADAPEPQPVAVAGPTRPAGAVVTGAVRNHLSVAAVLMLCWAALSAVLLGRFLLMVIATRRLLRDAVPLGPGWLPIDLEALRRAAGVRTSVRWAVSPRLTSPAVGGLRRPTVVVPPDLDDGLTPKQLTWVLLHELAHVRRGDLWVVMAQRVAQACFFFHPAVHLANWIIDQLREYACDDAALAACQTSRRDCGEGFLTVVGRSVERAPAAVAALGLFESRMLIHRRLVRILDPRRKVHGRLSPGAAVGLLAAALIVLPYGCSRHAAVFARPTVLEAVAPGPHESSNFRPGAVWHEKVAALAVAYSPDGTLLAAAGEDGAVVLRDVASGRVVRRFSAHRESVACLAFAPDGHTLATGSYDRTLKLWDVASGALRATLSGHTNWVFAAAFAPDGKTLASAGHDQTMRLWDVASGRESAVLAGHAGSVRAVAFSPDGTRLASGGADRVARLWDLRSKSVVAMMTGHKGTIRALAFGPGGLLATAGEDGEARLWDAASGRERATLAGHSDMIVCLAFSPRGGTLATGGLDSLVKLWDPRTGRERATLQGHADGVSAVAFAPGARQMATGSFDGSIRLWEPAAPIFSASACLDYPGAARAVAFTPDGRSVVAAGSAGIARWDPRTGAPLAPADRAGDLATLAIASTGSAYATGGNVRTADYSPDGRRLATGGLDGSVWLRDGSNPGSVPRLLTRLARPVQCVRFAPDGRTLAIATGDPAQDVAGRTVLWDLDAGRIRGELPGPARGVAAVAFAPDGTTIATADVDGTVTLRDAGTLASRLTLRHTSCQSVAFAPDGRWLASAHGPEVVIWDARDGRQLGLLKGHRDVVAQVAFAPDGTTIATACVDGTVTLWNPSSRRQTARAALRGDLDCVWSVAYSPDGQTLAVADGPFDAPGAITLWDVATHRVRARLDGHELGVAAAVFGPDGRTIASVGWDGTVRVWDLATGRQRYELSGLDGVRDLAISPDGTCLATAGEGTFVTLWDLETGAETGRLTGLRFPVRRVAFSPDGRRLATGGGTYENQTGRAAAGEVALWDLSSRTVVATFEGHTRGVHSLTFSPNGLTLATGGGDGTIRVWDLPTGRTRLLLNGLPNCVQALAFSPDGMMMAWSGRGDGGVSVLDARTGREAARLVGHRAVVRGIAFAPDGLGLATGGADRSVRLWDAPTLGASNLSRSQ